MNLHDETYSELKEHGYGKDDIDWIGNKELTIDQEQFWEIADTEYDDGFGTQEVAEDLIIVMKDGSHFYRSEYDGAERWNYRAPLKEPKRHMKKLEALTVRQTKNGWLDHVALRTLNDSAITMD